MKRLILVVSVLFLLAGLLSGCGGDDPAAPNTDTPSGEAVPTLAEAFSGTWNLHAAFDQSGEMIYASDDWAVLTYTFDADGGFTGTYQGMGVDSTFSGVYDCSNSQLADKNPYNWYYYATIDADSIADSGSSSLMGKIGEQGLHLIFKFRDLDGDKVLFEEMQSNYFKR